MCLILKPKQYHNDSAVRYIRTLFFAILLFSLRFSPLENQENSNLMPKIAFTIVVPFRDENENLPLLF
jgi:hypothetical protein